MRAHVGGALQDRLLQGARGAGMHIVRREAGLGLGGFGDCLVEVAFFRLDPIQDTRLIEMDVRFDKARRDETAAEIDSLAVGCKPRLDRCNLAACDPDIGQHLLGTYSACVSQNEIHPSPRLPALITLTAHDHTNGPRPPRYAFTSAGSLNLAALQPLFNGPPPASGRRPSRQS